MITLEDKIDIFYKLIYKEEEKKHKQTLEELEKKNNHIVEEKRNELAKKKEEIINRRKILGESQKNEMIYKRIEENRTRAFEKREEILKDLVLGLEERARLFTDTGEYKDYIMKRLQQSMEELEEEYMSIGFLEKDRLLLEEEIFVLSEKNNKKISLYTIKEDIIGGFILADEDKTYNLDNGFRTIIEENKYLIGKTLYGALEKTGDLNG